jgi:hypothetical protein
LLKILIPPLWVDEDFHAFIENTLGFEEVEDIEFDS